MYDTSLQGRFNMCGDSVGILINMNMFINLVNHRFYSILNTSDVSPYLQKKLNLPSICHHSIDLTVIFQNINEHIMEFLSCYKCHSHILDVKEKYNSFISFI